MVGVYLLEPIENRMDSLEGLIPNPACLLEAIEQFVKHADVFWSTHLESFRLLHIDLLLQLAIKIGMRDVYRAKFQVLQGCNGANGANGGVSDSRGKGLLEIEARAL
jgi:hypothetical protein